MYVERNARSTPNTVSIGVPQVSIVVAFLFLVFINELQSYLDAVTVSYADDTNIFLTESNIKELYARGNAVLESLAQWLFSSRLAPNVPETSYDILHAPRKSIYDDNHHVFFFNQNVVRVSPVKFLRLIMKRYHGDLL